MVLRKLTVERDRQFCKTLGMFLGEMHGKEYGLNAMNFVRFGAAHCAGCVCMAKLTHMTWVSRRVSVSDKDSYFCSGEECTVMWWYCAWACLTQACGTEVVAAGYKRLGLLPADVPSNSYLPSSFAAGSDIKLLKDAELGVCYELTSAFSCAAVLTFPPLFPSCVVLSALLGASQPELLLIFSEPGVAKASLTNDYVEESTELESSMSSTAAAAQAAMRSSVTYNSSQSRSAVSTRSSVDSVGPMKAVGFGVVSGLVGSGLACFWCW